MRPETASERCYDPQPFTIIAALNRVWTLLLHNARLIYIVRAPMAHHRADPQLLLKASIFGQLQLVDFNLDLKRHGLRHFSC